MFEQEEVIKKQTRSKRDTVNRVYQVQRKNQKLLGRAKISRHCMQRDLEKTDIMNKER
jgi:hypothetical protein